MESDDDVQLRTLGVGRKPLAGAKIPAKSRPDVSDESSDEPETSFRKHYTLDNLGADSNALDEYDLGSLASEDESGSDSDDGSSAADGGERSDQEGEVAFNYLAFDAARDRVLDKQVWVCSRAFIL